MKFYITRRPQTTRHHESCVGPPTRRPAISDHRDCTNTNCPFRKHPFSLRLPSHTLCSNRNIDCMLQKKQPRPLVAACHTLAHFVARALSKKNTPAPHRHVLGLPVHRLNGQRGASQCWGKLLMAAPQVEGHVRHRMCVGGEGRQTESSEQRSRSKGAPTYFLHADKCSLDVMVTWDFKWSPEIWAYATKNTVSSFTVRFVGSGRL
jgi:hypothetical protein